jgi:hypothetical protein
MWVQTEGSALQSGCGDRLAAYGPRPPSLPSRPACAREQELGVRSMFESLDEQMKHDDMETTTPREKYLRWALVGIVSLLLFGGLYMGVRFIQ